MNLWDYSSLQKSDGNEFELEGSTPEEIGLSFAATVDVSGLSEAEILQAALADAENWSDDPVEQGKYLYGIKQGLGQQVAGREVYKCINQKSKIMTYEPRYCPTCKTATMQRFISRNGQTVAWKCRACGNKHSTDG